MAPQFIQHQQRPWKAKSRSAIQRTHVTNHESSLMLSHDGANALDPEQNSIQFTFSRLLLEDKFSHYVSFKINPFRSLSCDRLAAFSTATATSPDSAI
jgi:hypothetical protein